MRPELAQAMAHHEADEISCACGWVSMAEDYQAARRELAKHIEEAWELTYEKATPLYIGPLPHYARRMLQALDAYWLHCDGLPKGRYPRSRATAEDWWGRFEKYRALVKGQL